MTMIEQVARAFCGARFLNGGNEDDDGWDDAPADLKAEYRAQARIAILAMRQPSEAMVKADLFPHENLSKPWIAYQVVEGCEIEDVWRAMIDAALNEKEG